MVLTVQRSLARSKSSRVKLSSSVEIMPNVLPRHQVLAAEARESDVAIATNVGYRRCVANEEARAREMLVKGVQC